MSWNWSRIVRMVSPSSSTSRVGQPGRRLVEQQEARLGGQRPGDLEPLQRAEREARRRAVRQRTEAELVEQLAGSLAHPPVLATGADARDRPDEPDAALAVLADHHVLEQGHRREQGEVLERAGDAGPGDLVRRQGEQVESVEPHQAGGRVVDATDDVEHRRLARAVGPDQTADLAVVDGEAELVEGDDPAEPHRHFTHVEQRHADRASPSSVSSRNERSFPCRCGENVAVPVSVLKRPLTCDVTGSVHSDGERRHDVPSARRRGEAGERAGRRARRR